MEEVEMDTASSTTTRPSNRRAFTAVLRIFSAPSSVLADVKAGLPWWPGLAVLAGLALVLGLLMLPVNRELMTLDVASGQMQGMELGENGQLPAPLHWSLIGGAVLGPLLGLPLMLLAVTFFYWLALTVTFGSAPYRRLFTLSVYTSFIAMAYQVINTLYLRFAGLELTTMKDLQNSALKLSLGAFVAEEGFLANFLGQIGIFQLWELWIFVGGVALLLERKRSAVAVPILVVFLLGISLMAFLATLGTRFGG
jgi:hypothetical protein